MNSLLEYWEVKNVKDTAFQDGVEEGVLKGKIEVACALKAQGIANAIIATATGLTEPEIEALK